MLVPGPVVMRQSWCGSCTALEGQGAQAMKVKLATGIVTLLALMLVMIVEVPSAAATAYDLNIWSSPDASSANIGTAVIHVTVTPLSGGNYDVTFSWVQGNSALTALGLDKVGIEFPSGTFAWVNLNGWNNDGGKKGGVQRDGFGAFDLGASQPSGDSLSVTFRVNGQVAPTQFVAHVRWEGCSGWASNRPGGAGLDEEGYCGGTSTPPTVPEPSSTLLISFGLLAVAGLGRRWLRVEHP